MKSFLFLIPAAVVAATLARTTAGTPQEKEVDAGSKIEILCSLEGAQLAWYWIPRYPICAGTEVGPKIFFMISNSTPVNRKGDRFQKPSSLTLEKINGSFSLIIKLQHMNDSGTFYCSNGKKTASKISVVVKSDHQSGMMVETSKDSHQGKQRVTLTCKACENKSEVKTHTSTTISWTLNGKEASDHILRHLKNRVILEKSPQNYGLWKCSHLICPTQFDGYCLENEFRTSEESENDETSWSIPAPPDTTKKFNIQMIGGSVIGLLVLLWIGAVVFALWEKFRSQRTSPSKTGKDPKSQGIKNSVGIEKPPEKQGKEKDMEVGEGMDGIQYSVLQFKELEQCQGQKDKGTPTVIYAEVPASNCSRS